jgi:hypothetical protein
MALAFQKIDLIRKEVTAILPIEPINKFWNRNSLFALLLEPFWFVCCITILVIGFVTEWVTLGNSIFIASHIFDNNDLWQQGESSTLENIVQPVNFQP